MSLKNPEDMMGAVASTMQERTGRSLEEWVAVVNESGLDPLDQGAVRKWLKAEHGIAQNTQWAIADAAATAAGWRRPEVDEYIAAQYSGDRAALRPVFDRVREALVGLGDDVTIAGRGGYIPFIRARQFAAVVAATKTRVDVGLRFTEAPDSDLLVPTKGLGQATHKLGLGSPDDVTDEVLGLFAAAYAQNGSGKAL